MNSEEYWKWKFLFNENTYGSFSTPSLTLPESSESALFRTIWIGTWWTRSGALEDSSGKGSVSDFLCLRKGFSGIGSFNGFRCPRKESSRNDSPKGLLSSLKDSGGRRISRNDSGVFLSSLNDSGNRLGSRKDSGYLLCSLEKFSWKLSPKGLLEITEGISGYFSLDDLLGIMEGGSGTLSPKGRSSMMVSSGKGSVSDLLFFQKGRRSKTASTDPREFLSWT